MATYTVILTTSDLDDRGLAFAAKRTGVAIQTSLDTVLLDYLRRVRNLYLGALSTSIETQVSADTTKIAGVATAAGIVLDKDGLP